MIRSQPRSGETMVEWEVRVGIFTGNLARAKHLEANSDVAWRPGAMVDWIHNGRTYYQLNGKRVRRHVFERELNRRYRLACKRQRHPRSSGCDEG